jgi:xanthine dehydrogenase accessory factor
VIERAVVEGVARLREIDEPYLIATVMRVSGSAYRRPGARMIVSHDRWIAGSVSGGCLESDVLMKGWWRTRERAALVSYDASVDDADDGDVLRANFGSGCGGVVDILLERSGSLLDPIAFMERCAAAETNGVLATIFVSRDPYVFVGARVAMSRSGVDCDPLPPVVRDWLIGVAREVHASGETGVFRLPGVCDALVEAITPPPRLFLLGTGHDVAPVAALSRLLGWECFVCAPKPRAEIRRRFPGERLLFGSPDELARAVDAAHRPIVIVMSHDYALDRAYLQVATTTRAHYVGVLGPRHRTDRMLRELGISGDGLHAPVGLELGAESPQEIALAIAAEIQASLTSSEAIELRRGVDAIHAGSGLRENGAEPRHDRVGGI